MCFFVSHRSLQRFCTQKLGQKLHILCQNVNEFELGPTVDEIIQVRYMRRQKAFSLVAVIHYPQAYINIRKQLYVEVAVNGMQFTRGTMFSRWYTGRWTIISLHFHSNQLHAIHADAFANSSLSKLCLLSIVSPATALSVDPDAFRGLENLIVLEIHARVHGSMPAGLFDTLAATLQKLQWDGWSDDVSLIDMFAGTVYPSLDMLRIIYVPWPQSNFRVLAAASLAPFHTLRYLILYNCGIEVIEENAFDVAGKTLYFINLTMNRIKIVNIDMFRVFFETAKLHAGLDIRANKGLVCTSNVHDLNLIQYPEPNRTFVECTPGVESAQAFRQRYQPVNPSKLCVQLRIQAPRRFVYIGIKRLGEQILMQTNFTSRIRILSIDADVLIANNNCSARIFKSNYRCLLVNRTMEQLDLTRMIGNRNVDLITITAIPILIQSRVCPFHSITVRGTTMVEAAAAATPSVDNNDRLSWAVVCLGGLVCVIVGFIGSFYSMLIWERRLQETNAAPVTEEVTKANQSPEH